MPVQYGIIFLKNHTAIENVQKIATKLVNKIRHLPHRETLQEVCLPTLEYRRTRADMLQVFKIIHKSH